MPNPIRTICPLRGGDRICQFASLLLDPIELSAYRLGQRSRTRQRPHHDHEVVDQTVVVEMQEVATGDLLAGHRCLEDQRMVMTVAVMDLTDVMKVLEDPQPTAQNRCGYRLSDIGLERHRAG